MQPIDEISLVCLQIFHLLLPPYDSGVMRSEDSDDVLVELIAITGEEKFSLTLHLFVSKDCNQRLSFETGFFQGDNPPADTGHAI